MMALPNYRQAVVGGPGALQGAREYYLITKCRIFYADSSHEIQLCMSKNVIKNLPALSLKSSFIYQQNSFKSAKKNYSTRNEYRIQTKSIGILHNGKNPKDDKFVKEA